jgi:hypothetical protein
MSTVGFPRTGGMEMSNLSQVLKTAVVAGSATGVMGALLIIVALA